MTFSIKTIPAHCLHLPDHASDITGSPPPEETPIDVVCLTDMGNTAAILKASPVLPPRQESELKAGIRYKWLKIAFERYYLWKMKHGFSRLP